MGLLGRWGCLLCAVRCVPGCTRVHSLSQGKLGVSNKQKALVYRACMGSSSELQQLPFLLPFLPHLGRHPHFAVRRGQVPPRRS